MSLLREGPIELSVGWRIRSPCGLVQELPATALLLTLEMCPMGPRDQMLNFNYFSFKQPHEANGQCNWTTQNQRLLTSPVGVV